MAFHPPHSHKRQQVVVVVVVVWGGEGGLVGKRTDLESSSEEFEVRGMVI